MRPNRPLAVVLVVSVLVSAAGTLVVADSPYERNVVAERNPFAPDRPAELTASTAETYAVAYEETRLRNALLSTRDHTLDVHDEVVAACEAESTSKNDAGGIRVALRCRGGIDDAKRLLEPGTFAYRVTYLVTDDETRQVGIEGYPLDRRDRLGTPLPE